MNPFAANLRLEKSMTQEQSAEKLGGERPIRQPLGDRRHAP